MVRRRDSDGRTHETLFTLADVAALETALQELPDCRLVVIDPIGSYLGGAVDSHRDNEVRGVLAPVAKLAEQYGAAVLIVAHRRKSAGFNADETALGSRAFTGIARAVWHLSRDPDDKRRRLLLPGKNNSAPEGDGLAFVIASDPPRIEWDRDPVRMSADDGLAREAASKSVDQARLGRPPAARTTATEWLSALLETGGVAVARIRAEAADAGLAWRTVQRACEDLGALRQYTANGGWQWRLPEPDRDGMSVDASSASL